MDCFSKKRRNKKYKAIDIKKITDRKNEPFTKIK
jgi:hypothetical protein